MTAWSFSLPLTSSSARGGTHSRSPRILHPREPRQSLMSWGRTSDAPPSPPREAGGTAVSPRWQAGGADTAPPRPETAGRPATQFRCRLARRSGCLPLGPRQRFGGKAGVIVNKHVDSQTRLPRLRQHRRPQARQQPTSDQRLHRSRLRSRTRIRCDLAAGELRKRGRKVTLQDQPFQVLALLLRHPSEVVTPGGITAGAVAGRHVRRIRARRQYSRQEDPPSAGGRC